MSFIDEIAARLAGAPPVRVLYTDLDGTLLGPGGSLLHDAGGRPSARAASALVEAAAAGLAVVPVSGRQREQLRENARLLGLADAIGEAGSITIRGGETHYSWGACPRDVAATPREALEAAGALDLVLERFAGEARRYLPWDEGREGGALLHGWIDVAVANDELERADLGWARVVDNGPADGWPGRDVRAYHLLPRGVGKATAVSDDLAARGLAKDEAAAIGDSPEDATMADAVGVYFRVANGHDAAAERAVATPGAMGDGVAQAITALLAAAEVSDARS